MALPTSFSSATAYFMEAVKFLKSYSWIYQQANTQFLAANVIATMPTEFVDYFLNTSIEDLNQFPLVHTNDLALSNEALIKYRAKLKVLIPETGLPETKGESELESSAASFRKMNEKKQYETVKLAHLIDALCKRDQTVFVDLGAGLGYLTEVLYKRNTVLFMLGLESNGEHVKAAQKRATQNLPHAKHIEYQQQFITEESESFLTDSIADFAHRHYLPQCSVVFVGLHACADLSITAIRLFLRLDNVTRLVIMPCCYHKMQMSSQTSFKNFPLSEALQRTVEDDDKCHYYFNRPFLRLASQQATARWSSYSLDEHRRRGEEMFRRAIADAIADGTEIVKKCKKHCQYQSTTDSAFTFTEFCEEYELTSKTTNASVPWQQRHKLKFDEIIKCYGDTGPKLAEGLVCLQTSMQKLCENIVLLDRLCYIEECALKHKLKLNARFQKLFNEKKSPRCHVLIVEKL